MGLSLCIQRSSTSRFLANVMRQFNERTITVGTSILAWEKSLLVWSAASGIIILTVFSLIKMILSLFFLNKTGA